MMKSGVRIDWNGIISVAMIKTKKTFLNGKR